MQRLLVKTTEHEFSTPTKVGPGYKTTNLYSILLVSNTTTFNRAHMSGRSIKL